jgi:energy-coupling factor transporter ATP-binding protein EcfA2
MCRPADDRGRHDDFGLRPSGSGKSTLFRAISGIWPYGRGTIDRPVDATVMLLSQRPYVPSGTLKTAVAYPSVADAYGDKAVREALGSPVSHRLPAKSTARSTGPSAFGRRAAASGDRAGQAGLAIPR